MADTKNDNIANDPKRDLLYQQLHPKVEKAVEEGIEDEKNKFRNGDGTFFGWLKGIIFQLAEAFGLDKLLAGFFGMHIPEENETKALTDQVTASVSNALTVKGPDGKYAAAHMSPEQLQETVKNRVAADIQNNATLANAFTSEKIEKIAAQAGDNAKDNLDTIRAVLNPSKPIVSDVKLAGSPQQQVEQTLGAMANGMLNNNPLINTAQQKADAQALKPVMVSIGTKIILEHKELIGNDEALAKLYIDELQKNDAARAGMQKLGLDLSNASVKSIVTDMLKSSMHDLTPTLAQAIKGEATVIKAAPPTHVDPEQFAAQTKRLVTEKVKEGIVTQVADQVLASWNEGGAKGWAIKKGVLFYHTDSVSQAAQTLNKYKDNPPADDQAKKEMAGAQHTLYQRAVELKKAPDNAQRTAIATVIAEASFTTLKDPNNKGLSQTEMGNVLQDNITAALKSNETNAETAIGINDEMISTIAKGIGDKVRAPGDPEGMYKMIQVAQATLLSADAKTVASAAGLKEPALGVDANSAPSVSAPIGRGAPPPVSLGRGGRGGRGALGPPVQPNLE